MSLVASITSRMRWLYRSSILRLTLLLSCLFAAGMAAASNHVYPMSCARAKCDRRLRIL